MHTSVYMQYMYIMNILCTFNNGQLLWKLSIKVTLGTLFSVKRFSSFEGSKCMVGIILGLSVVSFVERFIILCPYLGESTIGGSAVDIRMRYVYVSLTLCLLKVTSQASQEDGLLLKQTQSKFDFQLNPKNWNENSSL